MVQQVRQLLVATPRVVQVPVKKCSTCSLVKRIRRKWDGQGLMNSPGTKLQKKLSQACVENIPRPFWERNHPWDCSFSYFVVTSSRILFYIDFQYQSLDLIATQLWSRSALDQLPVLMQPEVVTFWNGSIQDSQLRNCQGFKLPCWAITLCDNVKTSGS